MFNYTINDCGEELPLEKLRETQIEMLNALHDFCEKNQIKYYLSGGTLLGAIRHNGYIPWDDDIDVNVSRPDCEKLQKLSNGAIGEFILYSPEDNYGINVEFWRLYSPNIIISQKVNNKTEPIYFPAFLDIFPIEGLPTSMTRTKLHYSLMVFLRKLKNMTYIDGFWVGNSFFRKCFHLLFKPIVLLIGEKNIHKRIQNLAKKYNFNESDFVGVMTAQSHTLCERVKKDEYATQIEVTFENNTYYAPKNYKTYLSQLYGDDYMELPPIEKRATHHEFKVYRRKSD